MGGKWAWTGAEEDIPNCPSGLGNLGEQFRLSRPESAMRPSTRGQQSLLTVMDAWSGPGP